MNIIERLKECNLTISTAESITGGLIASKICEIAGASNYFKGGVVSYTKEDKSDFKINDIAATIISKDKGVHIGNLYINRYAYNYTMDTIVIINTKGI